MAQLRDHKPEVLAQLCAEYRELAWRVAVLRLQVPPRGPSRYLAARPDSPAIHELGYCGACARAIEIVLNLVREGVK